MRKEVLTLGMSFLLLMITISGCTENTSKYIIVQGLLLPNQISGNKIMFSIIEGFTIENWMDLWVNNSSAYNSSYVMNHTLVLTKNGMVITENDSGNFSAELDGTYGMLDEIKVTGILGTTEIENSNGESNRVNSIDVKSIEMIKEYKVPSEPDTHLRSGIDRGYGVLQTSDEGFIMVGYTESHRDLSDDVWLIKTDTNGVEEWNRTFGGPKGDQGSAVKQTDDGGFIITGGTYSGDITAYDVLLIKTDENGTEQWNRTYGGKDDEFGQSVQQTSDGGYIITGQTHPADRFAFQVILIKTDSSGNEQWNRTFGEGNGTDQGWYVIQNSEGGYMIAGRRSIWLISTDQNGNELWDKTYHDSTGSLGYSVHQTSDGGYVVAGGNLLIKTDDHGNELWRKTLEEGARSGSFSMQPTKDGGYILTGYSVPVSPGDEDVWLIKTDSTGTRQWSRTFGGKEIDIGYSVQEVTDGGYIVVGFTNSYGAGFSDVWLIKTDSLGNELWNRTFG